MKKRGRRPGVNPLKNGVIFENLLIQLVHRHWNFIVRSFFDEFFRVLVTCIIYNEKTYSPPSLLAIVGANI